MTLSNQDKQKTQKLVNKIENQSFDENDIDSLLIKVRYHCSRNASVREVADMVAHSDKGNSGLVRENLRTMYLSMRHFQEYVSPKIELNLSRPFPSYILELMIKSIDKCDEDELRSKFQVSSKSLRKKIEKLFKNDKSSNTCIVRKDIPLETFEAIKHLLSYIRVVPSITGEVLVEELVAVLRTNGLDVDEKAFQKSADRIVLFALLLIHNRLHSYGGPKEGKCVITSDKSSRPTGEQVYPLEEIDKADFGHLQVNGQVTTNVGGRAVEFLFPVMTTTLPVGVWVGDSLFEHDDIAHTIADDYEHWYVWNLTTDGDLHIDEHCQLAKLEDS